MACISAHAEVTTLGSPNAEGQLRAAVVIGVLRFATQYDHEGKEYPVCLVGSPPSSQKVLEGSGVNISKNRAMAVRTLKVDEPTASCAAVVMGPDVTPEQQTRISAQAKESSSILICDDCSDDTLAHVSLRRKGERIVFVVDIGLSQQSQITFSSKLLSLAVETRR